MRDASEERVDQPSPSTTFPDPSPPRQPSQVKRFGTLLKAYREREKISQRRLAGYLGIDDSTIARIELGIRLPPRNPEFYDRLGQVPGFSERDVASLLATGDMPRFFVSEASEPAPDAFDPGVMRFPVIVAARDGQTISLDVEIRPSDSVATDEDKQLLAQDIRDDLEATLRDYLRRRQRRLHDASLD